MSDTLGTLCRRVRASRTRRGRVNWAWISVEPEAFSHRPGRGVGIAFIDGRRRGALFNRVLRSFPVEHGEHTVAVTLFPRYRGLAQAGKEVASLQIVLRPGAHARLLCRERPQWKPFEALIRRDHFLLLAVSILTAGVFWLAFPLLRDFIAAVTRRLAVAQPWLSLADRLYGSRVMTAMLDGVVCAITGTYVLLARHRRLHRAYRAKFGEPWILTEERECDGDPMGPPTLRE